MTRNNPYLAGVMNANQVAQDRAHSADMAAARNAVAAAKADAAHAESIADSKEDRIAIMENTIATLRASRDECYEGFKLVVAQRDKYKASASKNVEIIMKLYGDIDDLEDENTRLKKRIAELEKVNG